MVLNKALLEVFPLTPLLEPDFFRFHKNFPDGERCYCTAWYVEVRAEWRERNDRENRRHRQALFDNGVYDGYLLYYDEDPIGWCQVVRRDDIPKIMTEFQRLPEPDTWGVSCLRILPEYRRRGLARLLLKAVLADLKDNGVTSVEAYPSTITGATEESMWTGPDNLYRELGFEPVFESKTRTVWNLIL